MEGGQQAWRPPYLISVKDVKNYSLDIEGTVSPGMYDLFLSRKNVAKVVRLMYDDNILHNGHSKSVELSKFIENVPEMMREWEREGGSSFTDVTGADYTEVLRYMNTEFVKQHRHKFAICQREINPFRETAPVNGEQKRFIDMLASDFNQIDVWRDQTTQVSSKNYRYRNLIPPWQRTMNIRHYSRDNGGLRDTDYRSSSKQAPIRGYDMSAVYSRPTKYIDKSWTEL